MATAKHDNKPSLPQHVAVVMDGNGRWAKNRFLPRTTGHKAGVDATRRLVRSCVEKGIGCLTLFAFSSENWNRPDHEVSSLMALFLATLNSELNKLHQQGVRIRFIGDRSRFSASLQNSITAAEKKTEANTRLNLNVAANYGGRWDIANAVRNISHKLLKGDIEGQEITEQTISREISLSDLPEPDLLIRTGGEQRISNFLLWQIAYTELYFTDTLWPEFNDAAFDEALNWYATRQRRFGKTGEQVECGQGMR
ncbi:MAG: isoprenyl transferase [Gammaproteobacteria bacterium]